MGVGNGCECVSEGRCVVEWVGDESGRSGGMAVILDLEFLDKNILKYKLQMSLGVFISKMLW